MTQIYLIRHAQSANNALDESQRIPDPGLTDLGHRQAELTADWLGDKGLTQIHTSPFLRALETTRPIARKLKVKVRIRSDVFEQGGCYAGHLPGNKIGQPGLARNELEKRFPAWQISDDIDNTGWWRGRPYESPFEVTVRARKVAGWISSELIRGGHHAIVTHADFKRLLVAELLGHAADELKLGLVINAAVTKFVYTGTHWEMEWYNSIGHLPSECVTS